MTPDAISALAGKVNREWGSHGYRFESITPGLRWNSAIGKVAHSDGSRFFVAADAYGRTAHGDTREQAQHGLDLVAAADAGQMAALAGVHRAPAIDRTCIALVGGLSVGEGAVAIYKAWTDAYDAYDAVRAREAEEALS